MKIRSDFVTNSSSSSFVLRRNNGLDSIESVYEFLHKTYEDYICLRDNIELKYSKKYNIKLSDDKSCFVSENGQPLYRCSDGRRERLSKLSNQLGIDIVWSNWGSFEWLQCETYNDYVEFYREKIEQGVSIHSPFSLIDRTSDSVAYLPHYGREYSEIVGENEMASSSPYNAVKDLLDWYTCNESDYDDFDSDDDYYLKRENGELMYEGKKVFSVVSDIFVYSESGYMPDYVVERLCEISEFSCTHMG